MLAGRASSVEGENTGSINVIHTRHLSHTQERFLYSFMKCPSIYVPVVSAMTMIVNIHSSHHIL